MSNAFSKVIQLISAGIKLQFRAVWPVASKVILLTLCRIFKIIEVRQTRI